MNINTLVAMTTGQKSEPLNLMKETDEANSQGDNTPVSLSNTATSQGEEFTTFLTLLTAQIRNQDPLAPLDSTQFVEQLATFSSLELQANGNAALDRISSLLAQQLVLSNQSTSSEG